MPKIFKQKVSWYLVLSFLTIVIFTIYRATSGGTTPYNYFTRLADAFLQGKYYLDTNPPWLNELVPIGSEKFAVVYPPAPAIISFPFVLIFGTGFEQQTLSQIMGALAAYIWGLIAFQKSKNKITSLWFFLLASLGNIIWFLSSNGSVWYTGQVSAFLFLTLAIYESLNKKRVLLLVLYFGFAFLSRLQIVLSLPLFIYLNWDLLKNPRKLLSFSLGILSLGIIYGTYNYLRFGSFIETGYSLIPGVLDEPWYQKGIFNISYIPNHLSIMFASFPRILEKFPFIRPSWGGLAIWITSPVFIYSLLANIKNRMVQFIWFSIALIASVIFSHGSTGFAQFGYRFAVDFYPLVLFLIVEALGKTKLKWHHWFLLSVSILVNFWGVMCINKLGAVGW